MKQFIYILLVILFFSCSSNKMIISSHKKQSNLFLTTLESADVGKVSFFMEYKENNNTFEMSSQKSADIKLFGILKAIGARIFMNTMKKGALVSINGNVKKDSLIGKLMSPLGSFEFISIKKNDSITGRLVHQNHKLGIFKSHRVNTKSKIRDYKKLINEAINITESRIYNPSLIKNDSWRKFKKQIIKKSIYFDDDLELITYFFYKSRELPFSHFSILNKDYFSAKNIGEIIFEKMSNETAYLKIKSFNNNKNKLESNISSIIDNDYENLIIDLRDNYGGNIESALTLVSHLIDKPMNGGYFVTQKWYKKNPNVAPNKFNTNNFQIFSQADFNLLMKGIHEEEGLTLLVNPNLKYFKGNIFILTNKSTASTCEPIVYGLKNNKKAIIVGEKTAGAMLSAEPFELFDGFKLFVPIADYFTSDGERLDKKGVLPNYTVESKNALKYVLNNCVK